MRHAYNSSGGGVCIIVVMHSRTWRSKHGQWQNLNDNTTHNIYYLINDNDRSTFYSDAYTWQIVCHMFTITKHKRHDSNLMDLYHNHTLIFYRHTSTTSILVMVPSYKSTTYNHERHVDKWQTHTYTINEFS